MTEPEEMYDSVMRELNNVVISDTDEAKEKESFSFHEQEDLDDIPPSLLRYFETSKSRAAVCEKLILEEPEDFTASHHTEDMMDLPIELDKDMMELKVQVICDSENEENNTSTDTRLLPAPTETEALFTHNVSVCPNNNEDKAGTYEHMESENHFAFAMRTLEMSLNEEEQKKINEYKAEREKQHCADVKKEEQKKQTERDFQRELRKITEAETLHQMELELMAKRAQEKLEQEFLLQQELISNLQRRVEEERRKREEEQKRMKEEQDMKKREEEKIKIEAQRKRMEEEEKMKRDAERKRMEEEEKIKRDTERKRMEEEEKIKRETERKRMEEEEKIKREAERKRMEEEEKIKRGEERKRMEEEEKIKREAERKRLEEETAKKKEEQRKIEEIKLKKEERKNQEEEKRRMEREEKRKREEERYQMDLEKNRVENEMRMMNEEEDRKKKAEVMRIQEEEKEEERKKIEEVKKKMETETGKTEEEMSLKQEEEERKKREDEESDDRKKMAQEKMYEEGRKRNKKGCGNVDKEIKLEERKKKEEQERKNMEKTPRSIEEDEKRKRGHERKAKEEEQRRRQMEKMSRHMDEEDYRKSEEDMRLKEDKEGYRVFDVDRTMEHETKTKDKEEKQEEEKGNIKEERNHVEAEKMQNKEEVRENKKEVNNKTEEITLKTEVTLIRANGVQEKKEKIEHNSMIDQNEKNNMDKKERSLAFQLDGLSCAFSSPAPLRSECTISPASTEAMIPQHDLDKNVSQTTIDKTVDCENQEARASAVSVSLPMCLPEHTEQKRLTWMKDCIPWSKLSLQNRRQQKGSVRSRRGPRRAAEAGSLPPLCPDTLLQATGWKSLQQVTTVTLQDLPGCSLSTLAQCTQLRSLSLRRCGLKSLEGIKQLPHLCYIDVQENDISFVDCENMTSLRVLHLGHNKLTSIHGLAGAENLDVLDLSHNSITRIAGLESMRRLQRLSVDHNQLISTKGLRDVYSLLHLNCSHNHLANVEGLENSALLNTLDLRANSLTEPPSLNNQVLLRELHLDDNSISSLQGLTACWLPLMQHLSVTQNRITQLPSMSDFVSLANLDLQFNCMSELQNVCESLDGCQFLREVHLTGNPLQQESGWRPTLQKAVPGLRAIVEQKTDSSLTHPAVQQVSLASGSFPMFCQAQLQQTCDLQQQHSRELSNASSTLDAVQTSCQHLTEALQLAEDQRFAHEYGDTTVADKHRPAPEETLDLYNTIAEKHAGCPGMEYAGKVPSVIPNKDNIRCSSWTFDEKSAAGSLHASPEVAPQSNHQNLDIQNTAAVVIQQLWRKYREKCGNISSPSTAEKGGERGGDGREPESRSSYINGSVVGKDYAATVIQAFWRGFTLRRRLASALAAVTCPDTGEDDTFEEVDVDEFVFDEAALEKNWTLPLSEDPPCRHYPVSEQPLSLEPPGPFPEPSQYILPPPLVQRSKQAWVAGEQADSAGQRVSSVSSNRSKSPASTSVVSGLSERSEKIMEEWGFTNSQTALLMLKRAQNMKPQQKKHRDPSTHLALFRNCSYQLGPVEACNRQAQQTRTNRKVREAEVGLQREEKTERVKQERAQQWLHTQAAHSDRDSESMRFLPEISSDILNGGRVQLVADPGYTERLHHASRLWANSSLAAQPCKENSYPRRNSLGHAREEAPSPQQVKSAPTKKDRISFRDNPVQLSGGWGGGKRRGKVHK